MALNQFLALGGHSDAERAARPLVRPGSILDSSVYIPERHLPTLGQRGHNPQRHTAAGTVPQSANPTQTA